MIGTYLAFTKWKMFLHQEQVTPVMTYINIDRIFGSKRDDYCDVQPVNYDSESNVNPSFIQPLE